MNGKVKIVRRSGRADIAAGNAHVDVDMRQNYGLGSSSLCFANLMSFREGVFVTAMRRNYPSTGFARTYLNKTVSTTTRVAWLVLD